jgi:hypothetical protein
MVPNMNEESPMDQVTDLIASIEMHRKEIERESGLEVSRSYALGRLQQALREEQEATARLAEAAPERAVIAATLANEIRRVETLSRASSQRRPQGGGGRPQQQQRNFRQDQHRKSPKSRGRRAMGRNPGR